nr:serine/threonine protein kinase [Pyrinomonadaceae bacterium]
MNICPTCQQCFEDEHSLCLYDQTPLRLSRPGACLIGQKYRLDQLIVQDEMHAVYAGTLVETDRPVAITLLRPRLIAEEDARVRFRREAHAIAHLNTRIDNQHVARTLDYGSLPDGGEAFIVTELIAGQTLGEYMDETGQLSLTDALHIARQIVDGLGAAHRCGVVHRDLNPANVILTRNYQKRFEVKIVNFGITRLREPRPLLPASDGRHKHAALATSNSLAPYNSPEQRAGEEPDGRSDLYSLGVILYEMLAGRLPFAVGGAIVENTSASNGWEEQLLPLCDVRADVPEAVAQLVMQSLQSKPSSRPFSAVEFARQLRMDEHPVVATHLKQNATAVITPSVQTDAGGAAPIHQPDALPAVKAIFTSEKALPSVAAPVLSPLVANKTTAQQLQARSQRAPEQLQPTVIPKTIAPLAENKLEAQEPDSAPRKIIIYFEDETIFEGHKPGEDGGLIASPFLAAPAFVAGSFPEKTPSSTPPKRSAQVLKRTARRRRSALA